VAEDKKAAEQRDQIENLERSYSRLFETEDGKVVLQDLRNQCCVDSTTVPKMDHPNVNEVTHHNEGKRRVFLHIISRMKMSLTDFYLRKDKESKQ